MLMKTVLPRWWTAAMMGHEAEEQDEDSDDEDCDEVALNQESQEVHVSGLASLQGRIHVGPLQPQLTRPFPCLFFW